jgi:hypothetical protein
MADALIEQYSDSVEFWYGKAQFSGNQHKYAKAVEMSDMAIALDNDIDYLINRVYALRSLEYSGQAIAGVDKYLKTYPHNQSFLIQKM